ncbi:MAG: GAF domain-containing protein, partial [Aquificota bacterium]|nr:GAF domain-containing protein [Aquificota bacterium]
MNNPSLWISLVHPKDRDGVLRATLRMLKERKGGVREYRVKTRSGSYIWVEDRIIPIIEKGKVIGFVGVARDISKRKVIEELSLKSLEESVEELLSSVVQRVKDALNADLVVVYEVPEGRREGVLRAGAGINEKLINRLRLPLEEGTEFHYVFHSRKPVVIKDTEKEKRFRLSSDTFLLGLKSGLCMPVREGPNLYGAMCIYTKKKREFSEEEVRFAQSVANLIGLALRRQRFERKLESSERRLQKVNRLYRTLSEISALILRGGDIKEILTGVCEVCVQHGGFKASWIGFLENSHLRVLCSYGGIEDFLNGVEKPILTSIERGRGPCGKAVETGEVVVNNDTESSVEDERLREEMLKRDFLSSASIPLLKDGKVMGLFVLYAGEKGFFDEETESLVREIGKEITFSIEFTEKEDRLNKLSLAVEPSSDWILITDREGHIQYANGAVERISGYSRKELIGKKASIFKSGKHKADFYRKLWEKILSGMTFRSVFINRRKDGKLFYLDQTITPIKDAQGNVVGFVSTGKDITQERLRDRLNSIAYYDPSRTFPTGS